MSGKIYIHEIFTPILTVYLALSTNHIDLNLTMTGQAIIIVTPGVGVFEVSHDPVSEQMI